MRISPDDTKLRLGLVAVAAGQGRFEQAAESCLQILEEDPNNALALWQLGVALEGQGRKQEARDAFCLAAGLDSALRAAREKCESKVR